MKFKTVIGLEIHTQLFTNSKIFCNCSTQFGGEPNSQTCPVCLGLPGALPVLNEESLNLALKVALALNCNVAESIKFDRKNYFYPDLPKNYQISQYDKPLAKEGFLKIEDSNENIKEIGIGRIHLEEDAGKLVHTNKGDYSLVDFNRTGTPLLEIVTEPDINSPQEAYRFLHKLKAMLRYLEVSDCNMEEGSLRCDANISIKPTDSDKQGVKSEVKNMNSFKGVRDALGYEVQRQIEEIDSGGEITQETRLWDEKEKMTTSMRSKEEAHDYRYFPEPDLVYFEISSEKVEEVKGELPELPEKKRERFIEDYGLPEYDAGVLIAEKLIGDFFEDCASFFENYKLISNWVMGQVMEILNKKKISFEELALTPERFVELLKLVDNEKINTSTAEDVFIHMVEENKSPQKIVEEENLAQISDSDKLGNIVQEIINENKQSVEDYRAGKKKAVMYLVGQVMKKTKGKANPQKAKKILERKLS